jgi:hypothetical protein
MFLAARTNLFCDEFGVIDYVLKTSLLICGSLSASLSNLYALLSSVWSFILLAIWLKKFLFSDSHLSRMIDSRMLMLYLLEIKLLLFFISSDLSRERILLLYF